jgi:KUP system potassium uptake protein
MAISPHYAVSFLMTHSVLGFVVLGSVFLTVTGAEALYADMGHFGRKPIAAMWTWLVLPALALNYLGQGAMVLAHPETTGNPFFLMAPDFLQIPLVILATLATIVASQAVITGAFSLTQQAVQLGLLPRLQIVNTSAKRTRPDLHAADQLPAARRRRLPRPRVQVIVRARLGLWRLRHRRDDHLLAC